MRRDNPWPARRDKIWNRLHEEWCWWHKQGLNPAQEARYRQRWNQLKDNADQLWAEADKKSMELGIPYQRRDKSIWTPDGLPRLGNFERALQTLLARIDEGRITWPPAQ